VSERFKEHAWKACVGETQPWVRIPPSPPYLKRTPTWALRIAKQITEAFEYAHERGIVRRDLKPRHVKVSSGDAVKVAHLVGRDSSSCVARRSRFFKNWAWANSPLSGHVGFKSVDGNSTDSTGVERGKRHNKGLPSRKRGFGNGR
jgi:hypothetical protein